MRAACVVLLFFMLVDRLTGLAGLAAYVLVQVADPLPLVGLRRPHLADVRRRLAHVLFVDPPHDDPRRALDLELDARRRRHLHGPGVADGQDQVAPLHLGAVAHALQLQRLGEPFADADYHVLDEGTGQPVGGAVPGVVARPLHRQHAVAQLELHRGVEVAVELALGALDGDPRAFDLDLNPAGNRDRYLAYARHLRSSPDIADDFPAQPPPPRLAAGKQPLRRGHDGDTQPAVDARDFALLHVDPQPRLAHALEPGDRRLTPVRVGQVDAHGALHTVLQHLVVADEPLLLERLRQGDLHLGGGHIREVMPRREGVADPRQHIGDPVCYHGPRPTSWTSSLPAGGLPGPAGGSRYGRARRSAGRHAGGRSGGSGCGAAPGTSASCGTSSRRVPFGSLHLLLSPS